MRACAYVRGLSVLPAPACFVFVLALLLPSRQKARVLKRKRWKKEETYREERVANRDRKVGSSPHSYGERTKRDETEA